MNLSKILDLNEYQLKKIENVEFKLEHLGALEFDLLVTDCEFNDKKVHFRIERVPTQTALRIGDSSKLEEMIPKSLKSFIAAPVEAHELSYFDYDNDALSILSSIISKFQISPSLFR